MVGSSPMQAVLVAPGVKDKKVLAFRRDALKEKDAVAALMRTIAAGGVRSAFYVFDLARVVDLYRGWRRALPGVRACYAVKCNPEPALLGALAALGAGFDCASRREIEAVLALGVQPASIVYANPCKPEAHLEYAAEVGVNLTTYDSEEEVIKVKRCHPGCELILRIKGPDGGEARPGRYFAETAFTMAARVIGKRTRGEVREYWIDDGLYGTLSCIPMDHYVPQPRPLAVPRAGEKTYTSTVFGPTCDSLDTVVTGYQLPEMSVGDWLVFDDMGAYTTASGSNFNGFSTSDIKTYLAYSS
uniref:ornithine decarboxylase n=1 Tax=Aegilops tauschii subsp. strangulata TaxID=200361 RepID=A0A453LHU3_AEGTS